MGMPQSAVPTPTRAPAPFHFIVLRATIIAVSQNGALELGIPIEG
jgi:hypothetical protein